jgi:hypothetical protein
MQSNPIKNEKQMERRKQTEMISTLLLLFGKALKFKHCMGRQSATQKRLITLDVKQTLNVVSQIGTTTTTTR